jgi:capsular polysaccharide biosynthesis protein/GGDEF domain-containing protein
MFFQQLFKAITNGWKWIILITLIAVVISLGISATTTPIYRTQATFIIAPNKDLPSSRDIVSAFTALDTLDIFSTYADILSSDRVYDEALKTIDIGQDELAAYSRSTTMKPESLILELTVDGPDPQITTSLANEIGTYGIQFINAYFSVFEIDFLDQAVTPTQIYRPRVYRDMGMAAGIGLLSGLLLVVIKEFIEIPLNQFAKRFAQDSESSALTKRSIEKAMLAMKAKDDEWPITLILIKLKDLPELFTILPGFSRKKVATEIVSRLKEHLKGNDLIGRWDASTFCIVLPRTPQKVSAIIEKRLVEVFTASIRYGVTDSEQILLEPVVSAGTSTNAKEFDVFVKDVEKNIEGMKW